MPTILIVTDDAGRAASLKASLARENNRLLVVAPGEAAAFGDQQYDLVLFDCDPAAPLSHAEAVVQPLRARRQVPTLALLSERHLAEFRDGVSDFVMKPYGDAELLTRIKRVLGNGPGGEPQLIRFGDLVIDTASYDVMVGGRKLDLTFTEYKLLEFMASHSGRVLTREAILDAVWGCDCFVGDRTVDVHIRRLRSKIEEGGRSFIETVRNVGYRFKKTP